MLSAYLPSTSSTSRRRLRYSDRNRLRRIVNSQAAILVPGWNESILARARSTVSWTRSSARSTLPHSEMANARRFGIEPSTASRVEGSRVIRLPLSYSVLLRRPPPRHQAEAPCHSFPPHRADEAARRTGPAPPA